MLKIDVLEAIDASIEKWKRIVAGKEYVYRDDVGSCPLCEVFPTFGGYIRCQFCIIPDVNCRNTPFYSTEYWAAVYNRRTCLVKPSHNDNFMLSYLYNLRREFIVGGIQGEYLVD